MSSKWESIFFRIMILSRRAQGNLTIALTPRRVSKICPCLPQIGVHEDVEDVSLAEEQICFESVTNSSEFLTCWVWGCRCCRRTWANATLWDRKYTVRIWTSSCRKASWITTISGGRDERMKILNSGMLSMLDGFQRPPWTVWDKNGKWFVLKVVSSCNILLICHFWWRYA